MTARTARAASHTAGETEVQASAVAEVAGPDGEALGTVRLAATSGGQMHPIWRLPGILHGIHVHETGDRSADDCTILPSGDAGERVACGVIEKSGQP